MLLSLNIDGFRLCFYNNNFESLEIVQIAQARFYLENV